MIEPTTDTMSRKEVVGWTLQVASTLALLIGAWFFGSLITKLEDLSKAVNELKVNVAVMGKNEERLGRLESKLIQLEKDQHGHERASGHPVLVARVAALEKK